MNLIKKVSLLAVLFSLSLVTACSSGDKKPDQQAVEQGVAAQTQTIRLFSYKFAPNTLAINVGDSVTFENSDPDVRNVSIPALNIDQNIQAGKSWTYTFNTAGEYAVSDRLTEGNPTLTLVVQ